MAKPLIRLEGPLGVTFQDTLDRHLQAIKTRDLAALESTVARHRVVVVTSDGRLVSSTRQFLQMHRDWFASNTWSLDTEQLSISESPELAIVVLKLRYTDRPDGKPAIDEQSFLTLAFAQQNGRWEMFFDQNTPCRSSTN
jgi:ketosteroid isomerase-like protein